VLFKPKKEHRMSTMESERHNTYWPDRIREQNAAALKLQEPKSKRPADQQDNTPPRADPDKSKGELNEGRPHPSPANGDSNG